MTACRWCCSGSYACVAELKALASPTQLAAPEQRHSESSVALQLIADVVLPLAKLKHLFGKIWACRHSALTRWYTQRPRRTGKIWLGSSRCAKRSRTHVGVSHLWRCKAFGRRQRGPEVRLQIQLPAVALWIIR